MAEQNRLTPQQEANRQRDGKFGAYGHSDKDLPELGGRRLVPPGTSRGGLPAWTGKGPRERPPALDQESQSLLDSDLGAILEDTSLNEKDKARYQDMAEQLSRYGTVDMAAARGPRAIRFGKGSRYGGDIVPRQFKSFHAKTESTATRRAEESIAIVSAAAKAVQENPEALKKSRFARLFGQ